MKNAEMTHDGYTCRKDESAAMSLIASASASPVGLSVHRLPREVTASLESNSFTSAVISTDNQGRGVLVVDDPAHSRSASRPDLGSRSHVDDLRQRAHAIAGRPRLLKPEASTSVDWTYCRRNQSLFSEDLFGDDRFRQDQRQYSDTFHKQAQRRGARDRARDGMLVAEALGRHRERQAAAFAEGAQSLTRAPTARCAPAAHADHSSRARGFAHALERLHRFYGEDLFGPFRPGYYYRRMPILTKTFDNGVRTEWRMTEGIPFVPFALDSRPRFILDATGSLWQQADTRPKVAGSRRVTAREDAAGETGQLFKNHAEEPSQVLTLSSTPPPEEPYLSRAAQWATRGESPAESLSKLSESRWRSFVDLAR